MLPSKRLHILGYYTGTAEECYDTVQFSKKHNIKPLVEKYLKAEFAKLNSKNTLKIENLHGGKPWVTDPNHWNYEAAKKATLVLFPC